MNSRSARATFTRWQAGILLAATCAVVWLGVFLGLGPRIEAAFFEPIQHVSYIDVARYGNRVCWTMRLQKIWPAMLETSVYWLDYNRTRIPLAVTLNGSNLPLIITPGPPINIGEYCADLPKGSSYSGAQIVNVRMYRSALCCWDFFITLPTLIVPGFVGGGEQGNFRNENR